MNPQNQMSVISDNDRAQEAVRQLLADNRRGQSCTIIFNDAGNSHPALAPYQQRLIDKVANRIQSQNTFHQK